MVDHLLLTCFLLALLARAFLLACSMSKQASKGPIPTHNFRTPCPAIPPKKKSAIETFPAQNTTRLGESTFTQKNLSFFQKRYLEFFFNSFIF
jgi:hypothetical protein